MPASTTHQPYPLFGEKQLLEDFIRLGQDASPRKIRVFATKYGPLGEEVNLYAADGSYVGFGASLWAWQLEAERVSILASLLDLVDREAVAELAPFVIWTDTRWMRRVRVRIVAIGGRPDLRLARGLRGEDASDEDRVAATFVDDVVLARTGRDPNGLLARWRTGDILAPVGFYLNRCVAQQLAGRVDIAPMVYPERMLLHMPDSLRTAIYLQLAQRRLTARWPERKCAYDACPQGRFMPSRRNQRYCSDQCKWKASYQRHPRRGVKGPERS
jgi:hypothetical protein